MNREQECSKCHWWESQSCHRHAPTIRPIELDGGGYSKAEWPPTNFFDWCGDYQPRKQHSTTPETSDE